MFVALLNLLYVQKHILALLLFKLYSIFFLDKNPKIYFSYDTMPSIVVNA